MSPTRLPNVPESTETEHRATRTEHKGWMLSSTQSPPLLSSPRVGQSQPAQPICWVGPAVHPINPDSGSQVQPHKVSGLYHELDVWLT